jgi:UDP-glucose 4-epimerase
MKKILVTGNAGYIGSHLTKMLNNSSYDYELSGLDRQEPIIHSVVNHYNEDIRNQQENWIAGEVEFDCVIHMAAEVAVGRSVHNPLLYYQTNTIGTYNILKRLKYKNFIFASTGSASGMNSPYSISKKAAEEIVEQYCRENSIPYTIFRFYNVVGTDGIPPTNPDGLMWNLIKAKETGRFNLFGRDYKTKDGTCVRDYTHVNEICHGLIQGIDGPTNQIENLGHGVGSTVLEMIDLFKKVNNCDFEVVDVGRRAGDLECTVLPTPSRYMKHLYSMEDLMKI